MSASCLNNIWILLNIRMMYVYQILGEYQEVTIPGRKVTQNWCQILRVAKLYHNNTFVITIQLESAENTGTLTCILNLCWYIDLSLLLKEWTIRNVGKAWSSPYLLWPIKLKQVKPLLQNDLWDWNRAYKFNNLILF